MAWLPGWAAAAPGTPKDCTGARASERDRGLGHLRSKDYAAAVPLLARALACDPHNADLQLALGLAYYRLADAAHAEPLLRAAKDSPDPEISSPARVFLGQILKERGATDEARVEIERARRDDRDTSGLAATARDLLTANRPRRLFGTLLISPELDGNVPLTAQDPWQAAPSASTDGDILFVASLGVRPLPSVGLVLAHTVSYRQQFRLSDFSLLIDTTQLSYSYLGGRHRVRAQATFHYANLGGSTLYLEGGGRASYRLGPWDGFGLGLSYEGRYRAYEKPAFAAFSGHSHTAQIEASFAVHPDPIAIALGYQLVRDQLSPQSYLGADDVIYVDDYRATGHGPYMRARARLHRRVELALWWLLQQRIFDAVDAQAGRRVDYALSWDLGVTVECTRWLDAFAGALLAYNQSTDPDYRFTKPGGYLGLSASFSAF